MVYVLRTLTYIRIETAFDQNPAKYVRVYVLGINHAWVKDKEMRPMRGVKCTYTHAGLQKKHRKFMVPFCQRPYNMLRYNTR